MQVQTKELGGQDPASITAEKQQMSALLGKHSNSLQV